MALAGRLPLSAGVALDLDAGAAAPLAARPRAPRPILCAIARRCCGVEPAVRLAKIGAQPGGSIMTKKVAKAEMKSSIT